MSGADMTPWPEPPPFTRLCQIVEGCSEGPLPWTPRLRSRLLRAVEAIQCLQVDEAIDILLELDGALHLIMRAYEAGSAHQIVKREREVPS